MSPCVEAAADALQTSPKRVALVATSSALKLALPAKPVALCARMGGMVIPPPKETAPSGSDPEVSGLQIKHPPWAPPD